MTKVMKKGTSRFHCLRCGHKYTGEYSPQEIRERACPRCGSNSVRRLRGLAPAQSQ